MKYVSERFSTPIASPKNGFWVKDDMIFDVTEATHVDFIIRHPYRFNLTKDDITLLYEHYGEPVGMEKQAREDLIKIATSQGWLRVRRYTKPSDRWTIQTDDTSERRDVIVDFLRWAIQNQIMTGDAAAIISGDAEEDVHEYKWEDGGISEYLNA